MDTSSLVIEGHSHRVLIHSLAYADEGWLDRFTIRVEGEGLAAEAVVSSANSGPELISFFQELENNWRGWEGEKVWRAFEGELGVSAKMSSQGRVAISFNLHKPAYDEGWSGQVTVAFYAGELQPLAANVSEFLGREP